MAAEADIQARVLAAFEAEYQEHVAGIHAILASWPDVSPSLLQEAFRLAHTIKGGARVCGLAGVEQLAHDLETLFGELSRQKTDAAGVPRETIEDALAALEDALASVFAPREAESAETSAPVEPSSPDLVRVRAADLDRLLQASGQLVTEGVRQQRIDRELRSVLSAMDSLRQWAGRLDDRLNSELAGLAKSLQQVRSAQQQSARSIQVLGDRFRDDIRQARMVPVGSVFEGFPKMLRDLAQEQRRRVRLTTAGFDVHADRSVLQQLKDPVMHALRNALAHGIEPADERRRAGKLEEGEIGLSVTSTADRLIIEISDDGRGINIAAIRGQLLARGEMAREEIDALTDEEVGDLLFKPGFSTAAELTTLAGRGVGLSVVREAAVRLHGSARFDLAQATGAHLRIDVPVSISTRRLLLATSKDRLYALPAESVHSVERVARLESVNGRKCVLVDGRPALLQTLGPASGFDDEIVRDERGYFHVAVFKEGNRLAALYLDAFLGETQSLIKSLPFPASRSKSFSGAAILDDARVALVINVDAILASSGLASIRDQEAVVPRVRRNPSILVVDDSFTARILQKSILESAGYTVRVAVDGEAALALLAQETIDAIVSDIQMPRMDGFELLAALKAREDTAKIPVVLVSSLGSKADQERGMSLGADAYIVKERFDHRELLGVIRQLI